MPLFEYVLLALLGSRGIMAPRTLGPESIIQPDGGALAMAPQEIPKKNGRHHTNKRRHRRHKSHRGHRKY